MKTIDYSYFIERYNAGEMNAKEKAWFELELKDNPALQKEVIVRKRTDKELNKTDILNLRSKLATIEKAREEIQANRPANSKVKSQVLKYAAVMTGIVVISGYLLISKLTTAGNLQTDDFFKPYPAQSVARSMDNTSNTDDYNIGMNYYNQQNYEQAIKYFSNSIQADPVNTQAVFMRANSKFALEQYNKAKPDYESVLMDRSSLNRDNAQWYLIDCYIQTNEKGKAIDNLKDIIASEGYYKKQATKLLRKLTKTEG